MAIEIICALIAVAGVAFSALISKSISKSTAKEELNRLEKTWEREDLVSSDGEFAEMASAVALFVHYNSGRHSEDAASKVAAVRSKEAGALGTILDKLYQAIQSQNGKLADSFLTDAINERRRIKEGRTNKTAEKESAK